MSHRINDQLLDDVIEQMRDKLAKIDKNWSKEIRENWDLRKALFEISLCETIEDAIEMAKKALKGG